MTGRSKECCTEGGRQKEKRQKIPKAKSSKEVIGGYEDNLWEEAEREFGSMR